MKPIATPKLYNDFSGLEHLKNYTHKNNKNALSAVAKQFEAIFLQTALKSMREANKALGEGYLSSDQMDFYQEMFDKQIAMHLSEQSSLGLADVIVRQMTPSLSAGTKD